MEQLKTHKFKLTDIKGKNYVEVHERIKFLREYCDYEILTDYQLIDNIWIVKATLKIHTEMGGNIRTFTGLAQEVIGEGFINKTSALENCETSAVGRACAMAGIGIIDSIASVDEINKAKNMKPQKPNFTPQSNRWNGAIEAIKSGQTTIDKIKESFTLTPENEKILCDSLK